LTLGRRLIRVGRLTPLRDCLAQLGVGKDEFDHLVLRPELGAPFSAVSSR
jgi:hypothetical protein